MLLTCAASFAALLIVSLPRPADACSFALPDTHELDPDEQGVDTTAPAQPEVTTVDFVRRPANSGGGCGTTVSSCDGSGEILLEVAPTSDDRSQPGQIGYIIELAGGDLPANMNLPSEPIRRDSAGNLWLLFSDDDQSLDFTLSVRAVDLAGNHSAPVMIDVVDGGAMGCSATHARTTAATWAIVFIAIVCAARMRRRRRVLAG